MRVTADTNILVRAIVEDDPVQSPVAQRELAEAELVAITMPVLCELVWVLGRLYKRPHDDIAAALRSLLDAENVTADRAAADAGLRLLDQGGDFADGVIAEAGKWLGANTFVSFDRQAIHLLQAAGEVARIPV